MMKIRVRFAPSPTGPLHIGGLRTALYNYLYAKKHGGDFILRIEDTDQKRLVKGSEDYIMEALTWAGIEPDEGGRKKGPFVPYNQSGRKDLYQKHIEQLVREGKAYYAFDNDEDLQKLRDESSRKGGAFLYSAQNRLQLKNSLTMTSQEVDRALAEKPFVTRLLVQPNREIVVYDKVRGTIRVNSNIIDDKILIKKDGLPTYHFANVIDDHLMEISTVIRGEEWLPSLPFHDLLYTAFGWKSPTFIHLPLILKPSGKGKLSKRDGDKLSIPVFPISWNKDNIGFKELGFLPEAMINYLALLGWSNKSGQEIYKMNQLIEEFHIEGIQKGGARFDYTKAKWINQQHLSSYAPEDLLIQFASYFKPLKSFSKENKIKIISLIASRIDLLSDIGAQIEVFIKNPSIDEKIAQKILKKNPIPILEKSKVLLLQKPFTDLKYALFDWAKSENVAIGSIMQTLRLSLVGNLSGPDLFSIMEILGKDVTLDRIVSATSFFVNLNLDS